MADSRFSRPVLQRARRWLGSGEVGAASVFEWTCAELEIATRLNALEARGTVRLALRKSGLDVRTVTVEEMLVVLRVALPGELTARAIESAKTLCEILATRLDRQEFPSVHGDTPDSIFARLGTRG